MNAICPARVISEAVRILNTLHPDDEGESEQIGQSIQDLQELRARLDRTGMTYICADGTNNSHRA